MNLSYAFLADNAQVENGKVYVLGGGVTILWRSEFPAAVGVTVVFSVAYNNVEVGNERAMGLQINLVGTHERAGQFASRLLYAYARRRYEQLRTLFHQPSGITPERNPNP